MESFLESHSSQQTHRRKRAEYDCEGEQEHYYQKHTSRWYKLVHRRHGNRLKYLAVILVYFILVHPWVLWIHRHAGCFTREKHVVWELAPSTLENHRLCPPISGNPYETLAVRQTSSDQATAAIDPRKICMTTLKNRREQESSIFESFNQCRDFDAVNTYDNHLRYANLHGYLYKDTSHILEESRPPAWSKIKAVQYMFRQYACEWVWWLDVDVVVMNPDIRLESLLPADKDIHLIVAEDKSFSVNSGSWIIRKSDWSHQFLAEWWNSKSFVRTKGISLSGDNAAFAALVDSKRREKTGGRSRIEILPRCHLNSFGVFLDAGDRQKSLDISKEPWHLSDGYYHIGDFVAHAAGIDRKGDAVRILLNHSSVV